MPRRHRRHRPHPLGHPRRADHAQRPSPHRPVRPDRRDPQRHHRELGRASGRRWSAGGTPSRPRPTPRCWRTWWASSTRATWKRRSPPRCGRWTAPTGSPSSRPTSPACWWRRGRARRCWWASARTSASSPPTPRPLLQHTRSVVYLDDGEMAVLTRDGLPGAEPGDHPDQQAGQPDRLGPRDGGAGRLRPLHAEGDLRAARESLQHAARPPAGGRGHVPGQRPQPERRRAQADRADHHHRLRHELALRPRSASTCSRSWRGSRSRSSTPREFRYRNPVVDDRHAGHRHHASRARPPTPWPRCARPSGAGRRTHRRW